MIARLVLLGSLLLTSCSESPRERCAECGMFVDLAPAWTVESSGQRYDTPKCALRAEGPAPHLRFRDYYSQDLAEGPSLRFVVGSDVRGPMGNDLVPMAAERTEHFIADHGGRAIDFAEINPAVLRGLDPE